MTHSKLSHSFVFVSAAALGAFALIGTGCAMSAGEPTSEETAQSTEADLRKNPVVNPTTQATLDEEPATNGNVVMPKAPIAPKLIGNDHVLGGGGEDNDGPRPHPWEPSPDTTTENNSGSSGSSSSTK